LGLTPSTLTAFKREKPADIAAQFAEADEDGEPE
jgi:hypothetical protein